MGFRTENRRYIVGRSFINYIVQYTLRRYLYGERVSVLNKQNETQRWNLYQISVWKLEVREFVEKLEVDGKIILKFVKEIFCETSGSSVCA